MNGQSPVPESPPVHGKPVLVAVRNEPKETRVLLCGDTPVARDALALKLNSAVDINVTGTTGSGMEAIILARKLRPDVVVTDLKLGGIPGLDMIRRLRSGDQDLAPQVVLFAVTDTDEIIGGVLRAGASGVLDQNASPEDLMSAVRLAARGQVMLAPRIAQWLVDWFVDQPCSSLAAPQPRHPLTRREQEVMLLVARGLGAEDIAVKLTVGVATARTHIYRVRCKLGVRDRAQIVAFAYQSGLMQPPAGGAL